MRQCSRCHVKENKRVFHSEKMCIDCHNKRISYTQNKQVSLIWRENNREKLCLYNMKLRHQWKMSAIDKYGKICKKCGEKDLPFLTIDHINNNGKSHRDKIGSGNGGAQFYKWLHNNDYPSGFQVLCFNCNCSKDREVSELKKLILSYYSNDTMI